MLPEQCHIALKEWAVTVRALAQGQQADARSALTLTKELVKKTESEYVPHVSDWEDWDPPSYIGVFKEGEIVGYHRHNREIERLEGELGGQ